MPSQVQVEAEVLQSLYTAATLKMAKTQFESYWVQHRLSDSFKDAKQLLLNCTTLAFPDPKNPLALSCDASDKHIGAVLEEFQDGNWRPIGYYSKHLTKARQNWSVFRRELLSIQAGIRNFKPDIIGRDLIIFTDHKSILGAMQSPNLAPNDPVATRALLEIAQYSHDIRYKPGKANLTADALSRPESVPPGDAYCPERDVIAAAKEIITTELLPANIYKEQAICQEIQNKLIGKKSPKSKLNVVDFKGFKLLCETSQDPKPYIPKSLRTSVMKACHDIDHAGQTESKRRAKSAYYWPDLGKT